MYIVHFSNLFCGTLFRIHQTEVSAVVIAFFSPLSALMLQTQVANMFQEFSVSSVPSVSHDVCTFDTVAYFHNWVLQGGIRS